MKKYLIGFNYKNCFWRIVANTDNLKPFIIYINGSQYGNNYATLGHCSRALAQWLPSRPEAIPVYGTVNDIRPHGSNVAWFNAAYKNKNNEAIPGNTARYFFAPAAA